MTEHIDPRVDTVTIKPRRVYKCTKDNRVMERSKVWKDAFGKFHCTFCGGKVEDITNTVTGHDWMEIVKI